MFSILLLFPCIFVFRFSVGWRRIRWICSDEGPYQDPHGPGAGAELSLWLAFLGSRGGLQGQEVMQGTPPQGISVSHLLHPLELKTYGNRELGPILFKPHGNNAYLSLFKVDDFPTPGSWVLIKKTTKKKNPISENVKYLKPPHCTFFQKP